MGDTTLSDERRRILRRVKRHLVRDMDAEDVLLQMTAENVFNTTEEERIKVKLTRSEKNKQLLDILPSKGEKAYEIFKETLQEVHPHLANIILELEKKDLGSEEQAERARQSPDSKTSCIPQEIKNSIIHEFLVSEEGFTEDCPTLTHLDQTEGRSPVIFREIPQLNEEPPVCEPSTSVESPVDDSAQIGESRKSVVTQRLATLFKDEIGNCWKDLGTFLGVPESILHNIEIDYDRVREKGGAVLQSWRDKEGSKATVGRLESLLIAMGKKRIAEKLLEMVRKETSSSAEEEKAVGGCKLGETKEERGKTKEELLLKKKKAARGKGTSRIELRRAER